MGNLSRLALLAVSCTVLGYLLAFAYVFSRYTQ